MKITDISDITKHMPDKYQDPLCDRINGLVKEYNEDLTSRTIFNFSCLICKKHSSDEKTHPLVYALNSIYCFIAGSFDIAERELEKFIKAQAEFVEQAP